MDGYSEVPTFFWTNPRLSGTAKSLALYLYGCGKPHCAIACACAALELSRPKLRKAFAALVDEGIAEQSGSLFSPLRRRTVKKGGAA